MVHEHRAFVSNVTAQSSLPYKFHVLSNERDVTPNTGFVLSATDKQNATFTADEALLSAMSSLKLQLLARVTVGNCCSNFHVLLADFLAGGCGSANINAFHCLQEHDDPNFRVCCGWFKNCVEEKKLSIAQMEANASNRSS
jgi:hypothetical protein